MHITVIQPGSRTTIQDLGRYGYEGSGIPVSGVLDTSAMMRANILVGNSPGHPVIECIGIGPALSFSSDIVFAVSGGLFSITLNGEPVRTEKAYAAHKGDELRVTYSRTHRSCCIALSGDFDFSPSLGSYSTDIKSSLGGPSGNSFKKGDIISLKNVRASVPHLNERELPEPNAKENITSLRVIEGPSEDRFTEDGKSAFYSGEYTVSLQSDRMGFRLEGPGIETVSGNDAVSFGIVKGAIQVTPSQPILMMSDHATTGGYTVIAAVISADLPKASQLIPGDKIRFIRATADEAAEAALLQKKKTKDLDKALNGTFFQRLSAKISGRKQQCI
ncbi:MAG: biotin-dependent carboxyltransferase family protein [Oscillospiraceae bacterium]|nr:biotin-dependent carboxyltransferase family protein [Oscillospiraceae bacterium]